MVSKPNISTPRFTYRPMLAGKKWISICGKPRSTCAGAQIFYQGGNAVDAAAAILATECVENDGVGFGGEMQALIYDPDRRKVLGVNGCGVAPTGATSQFFLKQGMAFPPAYGPLAAITPGVPGALMTMLSEFGTMSLREVLQPAVDTANGYPIVSNQALSGIASESSQSWYKKWKYSKTVFVPSPKVGQIFVQKDLANTLRKLIATEQQALAAGKSRREAIMAAYDRFYKGDIAVEFCRGSQEEGGLHTVEDLATWKCHIEDPVMTTYEDIEIYKLTTWTQGPVLLQMLNLLEGINLKAMGHNSAQYIHTIYQTMNLAYADRDFYYGDPYYPPEEPIEGLLSKEYADKRLKLINPNKNNPDLGPGDPYPFQNGKNPYLKYLRSWKSFDLDNRKDWRPDTTSIQTADSMGWVVSMTPSGAWPPAVLAGRTGVPMSQRMQSFVVNPAMNPYNVVEPGKRPRVTLTPSLAMKDGRPFLSFSLPGGDSQDQMLLQLFLNVVEFGMNIQEACEAAKFCSYQMYSSFGAHPRGRGRIDLDSRIPQKVVEKLKNMGYNVHVPTPDLSSTPGGELPSALTAILFDWEHQTFLGGASFQLERYGIAW